jgi:hypothetical protein
MSDHSHVRAYLGSVERHGAWPVPKHLEVRVVLGSCELDLRNAVLQPGVTTIDVGVVLGSVEIIVPKDMLVEVGMMAALASVDDPTGFAIGNEQHVLRVIGDATLASCEIVRAA